MNEAGLIGNGPAAVEAGLEFLRSTQNNDGGWGYAPGQSSVVEPTAAASLACALNGAPEAAAALAWLRSAQMNDGSWGISPSVPASSWMSAWAAWSLAEAGGAGTGVARGIAWLLGVPVLRLTDAGSVEDMRRLLDLDASVTGWPWQPGEASWVTPTALAVIAMSVSGQVAHPRVGEAVALLRDRACASGGWNFGNPVMIGKALPPLLSETGLALVALNAAGAGVGEPVVARGLAYLGDALGGAAGRLERSWAAVGAAAWRAHPGWQQLVCEDLENGPGSDAASVLATAVGLLALVEPERLLMVRV